MEGASERNPMVPRWIRAFQVFQFSFGMLLWLPVFYELQKRAGLTEAEIFRIQTYYYLAFCLLELPTGLIADRAGYRLSLFLGGAIGVGANLLPTFVASFDAFLWQFLLVALSRSFVSGAASAYLYERLAIDQAHSAYQSVEGSSRALGLVGKVLGWCFVGFWVERSPSGPYWASAGFLALATVSVLFLPPLSGAQPGRRLGATWASVLSSVRSERHFFWLLLQGVGLFVLGRVVQVNLYQPILKAHGVPVTGFGVGMSLMTLAEAFGSWKPHFAPRFLLGTNRVESVTRFTLLAALCLLLLAPMPQAAWQQGSQAVCSLGLLIFAWAMGAGYPLQKKVMNDAIPDPRLRASFLSLESIVDRAVNALVVAALGVFYLGTPFQLGVSLLVIGGSFFLLSMRVSRGLAAERAATLKTSGDAGTKSLMESSSA